VQSTPIAPRAEIAPRVEGAAQATRGRYQQLVTSQPGSIVTVRRPHRMPRNLPHHMPRKRRGHARSVPRLPGGCRNLLEIPLCPLDPVVDDPVVLDRWRSWVSRWRSWVQSR